LKKIHHPHGGYWISKGFKRIHQDKNLQQRSLENGLHCSDEVIIYVYGDGWNMIEIDKYSLFDPKSYTFIQRMIHF